MSNDNVDEQDEDEAIYNASQRHAEIMDDLDEFSSRVEAFSGGVCVFFMVGSLVMIIAAVSMLISAIR